MRYLKRGEGDRFHYRRGVPDYLRDQVGQREWKTTIHAPSLREAEAQARLLASEHDAIIFDHRSKTIVGRADADVAATRARLSQAYKKGAAPHKAERAHEAAFARKLAALDAAMPNGKAIWAKTQSADLRLKYLEGELRILELARDGRSDKSFSSCELAAFNLIVKPIFHKQLSLTHDLSPLLDKFSARELVARISSLKTEIGLARKILDENAPVSPLLGLEPPKKPTATSVDDPHNPRLLTATQAWLSSQKQSAETARKYRAYIRRLVEFVGDIPVRELRKKQINDFLLYLEALPDSNRLAAHDRGRLSMAQMIAQRRKWLDANPDAEPEDWPLVTIATVNKHLECIKALLAWVGSDQDDFTNVARDVRRRKETRSRAEYDVRPFKPEELARILEGADASWGVGSDMWWLIRLALLTGARIEELCQLARDNVREIDGIFVIEINAGSFTERGKKLRRTLKNSMSERLIPVHPWLIDKGFQKFATGNGPRIFSTFRSSGERYGRNPTKAFSRLLRDTLKVTDRRVRFHSFRHGFITALHNASVMQAQVNALAGHARAKGAAGRYIDELEVPVLYDAVARVRLL